DDRRDRADPAGSENLAPPEYPPPDRTHRGGNAGDDVGVDRRRHDPVGRPPAAEATGARTGRGTCRRRGPWPWALARPLAPLGHKFPGLKFTGHSRSLWSP